MSFKFVHTADIHLDSPLKTLAARNPELGAYIHEASRISFSRIIDLCLEEQVSALLISGDLYDSGQTSMKTARFLVHEFMRLKEAGIRVFIIRGNHDAQSRITRQLTFPDNVHVFGSRDDYITLDDDLLPFPVVLHGVSFSKPHAPESLLPKYSPPVDGAFNIALLHTSLNGSSVHDPYAPCSEKELYEKDYDYWALGHIHQGFIHHIGSQTIAMPGIPQGRDIGEEGKKSIILGTLHNDRTLDLKKVSVNPAEFMKINQSLEGVTEWRDMLTELTASIQEAAGKIHADAAIIRLELSGSTPLAWQIRRDHDLLIHELMTIGEKFGNVFIDKVLLTCEAPHMTRHETADAIIELRDYMDAMTTQSSPLMKDLTGLAGLLSSKLPPDMRDLFGKNEEEQTHHIQDWALEGIEDILAQLRLSPDEQNQDE